MKIAMESMAAFAVRSVLLMGALAGALSSGALSRMAAAFEPPVTDVAFSPDGKFAIAVSQAGIGMFTWPELMPQRTVDCASPNLHCLAFSPDGTQLAVGGGRPSEDGSVQVFSWPELRSVASFHTHSDSVRSVAWQNNTELWSASVDRQVKLWSLSNGAAESQLAEVRTLSGHARGVNALCLLADGETLVSAGADYSLRVWDTAAGDLVRSLNQHTQTVHTLALQPGDRRLPLVISAAEDRTIRLWQPTIGRLVRYARLKSPPLDVDWFPDGSVIVASCADGRVRLVDPDEVKVTRTISALSGWAYAIAVHPIDGTFLVGGSEGQLRRIIP